MTGGRIAPFGRISLAIAAVTAIFGLQFLLRDLIALRGGEAIDDYVRLGRDFVNVWQGGTLGATGRTAILYDIEAYRQSLWAALHVKGIYAYSYPPHSLFLAIPFSLIPYPMALLAWTLIGLALFVHAAAPYLRDVGLPWWLGAALPAGFVTVWAGHYGFFIGALALHGWRWFDRAPGKSGLAFAMMTIKPHLGLLVLPIMLLRRGWLAMTVAGGVTLALIAVSAALFGWQMWPTYLFHTLAFHAGLIDAPEMAFHTMMPTTAVAMLRLGAPEIWANGTQLATAAYALFVIVRSALARISTVDLGLMAGTAIFLILPYAFIYDMTVHCLAALVFAARARGVHAALRRIVLGLAFILPLVQMTLAAMHLPFAPLILLLALYVESRVALEQGDRA
ncbi:MAG: hypothetical protein ABS87_04700 [Sphingomonas sp. SCN 67-18]|nr:MAG: hypothetical protein ABS87_04700 [Sphingomonas sp. SCN 67-18]